jgi:hypothetical protein
MAIIAFKRTAHNLTIFFKKMKTKKNQMIKQYTIFLGGSKVTPNDNPDDNIDDDDDNNDNDDEGGSGVGVGGGDDDDLSGGYPQTPVSWLIRPVEPTG